MFHRTERLFLRPGFPEDWQAIHRAIASQDIVRMLARVPWPYTEEHAQQFAQLPQDPWLPNFMVTLPGRGVIGSAGLGIDDATGEVHLGYWLAREYWGRGYASEAARGLIDVARAIGHRRITASHFVDNPASGRVLRKAGFHPTGVVRPGYSLARGGFDPVACYEACLAEDCDGDGGNDGDMPATVRKAA